MVLFYRILPDRRDNTYTLLGISVTKLRWQLDAILGTFSKDFYLKTCINNFNLFFYNFHSCNVLRFANYIINLYVCMYVCM